MANENKKQVNREDGYSVEQKMKKKDPNRDVDPQREVDDDRDKESEKNPDDFE